jgi:3-oxoadipate enol-lactonase
MVQQEASLVSVDGVHAEVAGSGPPVVLSHDGLLDSRSWDAQVGVLAADHRVARWDRRGYGRSPRPAAPFSSVEDLAAIVRAVSDAPATLVGCSFGGSSRSSARSTTRGWSPRWSWSARSSPGCR